VAEDVHIVFAGAISVRAPMSAQDCLQLIGAVPPSHEARTVEPESLSRPMRSATFGLAGVQANAMRFPMVPILTATRPREQARPPLSAVSEQSPGAQ
jgi:hypothetical protein